MPKIYEQHDKAFQNVSAYVILKDGERVATIALKFPKDGAGRLYAYVHWIGTEMVRDYANGYGCDKSSAAVESAAALLVNPTTQPGTPHSQAWYDFIGALADIGGSTWDSKLRGAGFSVLRAV